MILPQRDDAHKKERKPHAGGGANNGRVMTSRADTRGAINDLELIFQSKKEGYEEEHEAQILKGLMAVRVQVEMELS